MKKIVSILPLFLLFQLLVFQSAFAQKKVQQKLPEKTRILFVLDASGSMQAAWENNTSRMDIAKKILTRLVDSLRVNQKLELALRVYGHRYPRQSNNCQDSNLEVPFGPKNHTAIIGEIKDIRPLGTTPITYSLLQAAKDFPQNAGYRNIVILITDGIESCGGDPCQVSLELQKKGVFLRPYVIGLGLKGSEVLNCVGKFHNAENTGTFNQLLNEAIENTFSKTTVSVELLDGEGRPSETNVNVTFVNTATGTASYEFIHYLNKQGRPDSVEVDPVLSYDIRVNTIPPVFKKNVSIVNGKHNVISIAAPQGNLIVRQEGRPRADWSIVIRRKEDDYGILNTQYVGEQFRYLKGIYNVETLTLPRRKFDAEIQPGKTSTLVLPTPGLVNINTITQGYGSLYEIVADGTQQWVCHLNGVKSQQSFDVLPGMYKVVFRAKESVGSKYTGVKTFEVKSGQTVNISVFD